MTSRCAHTLTTSLFHRVKVVILRAGGHWLFWLILTVFNSSVDFNFSKDEEELKKMFLKTAPIRRCALTSG